MKDIGLLGGGVWMEVAGDHILCWRTHKRFIVWFGGHILYVEDLLLHTLSPFQPLSPFLIWCEAFLPTKCWGDSGYNKVSEFKPKTPACKVWSPALWAISLSHELCSWFFSFILQLYSGMTPSRAWGTIRDAEVQTWCSHVQGKCLIYILSLCANLCFKR